MVGPPQLSRWESLLYEDDDVEIYRSRFRVDSHAPIFPGALSLARSIQQLLTTLNEINLDNDEDDSEEEEEEVEGEEEEIFENNGDEDDSDSNEEEFSLLGAYDEYRLRELMNYDVEERGDDDGDDSDSEEEEDDEEDEEEEDEDEESDFDEDEDEDFFHIPQR